MADEKNNKRFNMAISVELLNEIDQYRLSLGKEFPPARAEVVRELIRAGLRAKGYNPPPEK